MAYTNRRDRSPPPDKKKLKNSTPHPPRTVKDAPRASENLPSIASQAQIRQNAINLQKSDDARRANPHKFRPALNHQMADASSKKYPHDSQHPFHRRMIDVLGRKESSVQIGDMDQTRGRQRGYSPERQRENSPERQRPAWSVSSSMAKLAERSGRLSRKFSTRSNKKAGLAATTSSPAMTTSSELEEQDRTSNLELDTNEHDQSKKSKCVSSPLNLIPEGADSSEPTYRQVLEQKKEAKLRAMTQNTALIRSDSGVVKEKKQHPKKPIGLGVYMPTQTDESKEPARRFKSFGRKPSEDSNTPKNPFGRNPDKPQLTPTLDRQPCSPLQLDAAPKAAKVLGIGDMDRPPSNSKHQNTAPKAKKRFDKVQAMEVLAGRNFRFLEPEHESASKSHASRSNSNEFDTPSRRQKLLDLPSRVLKTVASAANARASPVKTDDTLAVPSEPVAKEHGYSKASYVTGLNDSSLIRSKSLKYLDNDAPPTPPDKDTMPRGLPRPSNEEGFAEMDMVPRALRLPADKIRSAEKARSADKAGSADKNQTLTSSQFGSNLEEAVVVNDGQQSPTRNGGFGRKKVVDVVRKPSVDSMQGIIEGRQKLRARRGGMSTSSYIRAKDNLIREEAELMSRRKVVSDTDEGSQNAEPSGHQPLQHRARLQPAFYTPTLYPSPSENKDFRPSHNYDPNVFTLLKPDVPPRSEKRTAPEIQQVSINRNNDDDDMHGETNKTKHVDSGMQAQQLTPAMESMLNRPSKKAHQASLRSFSDSVYSQHSDDYSIRGNAFYPKHAATNPPVKHSSESGLNDSQLSLPAIAPPEDVLTHFDILHHHIQDSTKFIHDAVNSKDAMAIAEIRRKHSESIQHLNEHYSDIAAHLSGLDDNVDRLNGEVELLAGGLDKLNGNTDHLIREIKRLSGEVISAKTEVIKKMEDLANVLQTDFISRLDQALFSNTELSTHVSGLVNRFRSLAEKQQSVIDFLGTNYGYIPDVRGAHSTGLDSSLNTAARTNAFAVPNFNPPTQGQRSSTNDIAIYPASAAYGQWSAPNLHSKGAINDPFPNYMHASSTGPAQGVYGNNLRSPQNRANTNNPPKTNATRTNANAHGYRTSENQSGQPTQIPRARARGRAHANSQPSATRDRNQNQSGQNVTGNAFSDSADSTQRSS